MGTSPPTGDHIAVALAVGLAAAAAVAPAGDASTSSTRAETAVVLPVKPIRVAGFGSVLATLRGQALYYWTPEKRAPRKIFCTGSCAQAWPVLHVPKGLTVRRTYAGFKGTFGTIRRPNGRLQLTYNRLPLYTYAHEGPNVVHCDNVDGWFVIRLR
jgi:predicted lipoprotein with Yx(FWY)xxD motif